MSRYGSISQFQGSSTGGYLNEEDVGGGGGAPTSYVNDVIGASTAAGAFGPPTLLIDQHCYVRGVKSDIIVEFVSIELLPDGGIGAFTVTFNGACQPSSTVFETEVTPVSLPNVLYPYSVVVSTSGAVTIAGDLVNGEESRLTFTRIVPA